MGAHAPSRAPSDVFKGLDGEDDWSIVWIMYYRCARIPPAAAMVEEHMRARYAHLKPPPYASFVKLLDKMRVEGRWLGKPKRV